MTSLAELTAKVRQIYHQSGGNPRTGRFFIEYVHIEQERIWREISQADVYAVMEDSSGKVVRVSDDPLSDAIYWQGKDKEGRTLELILHLEDAGYSRTLSVDDAYAVQVETAYEPDGKAADERRRQDWLKQNPDHEDDGNGGVRKREKR